MGADIVVTARGLGKRYRMGAATTPHGTLGEAVVASVGRAAKHLARRDRVRKEKKEHWALRDLTFQVQRGDVLGILGHNGAGKSTLLKILSRITEPTEGAVTLHGNVGSLLEVGSGFHPELSGRENIFLNGSILGMPRREVRRKFDEIVEFAEIAAFIDTPVKRYSSGMYARLAFSVAAHLETSILIVDEVLAVGDFAFQEKCLGKMRTASHHGRTVLFVSHNLSAVRSLCSRAMILERGRVILDGTTEEAIREYVDRYGLKSQGGQIPRSAYRPFSTGEAFIDSVELVEPDGTELSNLYLGQRFMVRVTFEVMTEIRDALLEVDLATIDGVVVTTSTSADGGRRPERLEPGVYVAELEMDLHLVPQRYTVTVGIHHFQNGQTIEWVERAAEVTVINVNVEGHDSYRFSPKGFVRPQGTWKMLPKPKSPSVGQLEPLAAPVDAMPEV